MLGVMLGVSVAGKAAVASCNGVPHERLGSIENPRSPAHQVALYLPLWRGAAPDQLDLVTSSGQPAPGSDRCAAGKRSPNSR